MTVQAPSFIDSKHLIIDEKGWRLKADASKELVKEFQDYMNMLK